MRSAASQPHARPGNVSDGRLGRVGTQREGRCSLGLGPTDQFVHLAVPLLLAASGFGTLGETLPGRSEARFGEGGQ